MQTEINFALGKNGGYIPSSLGSISISVSRQAVRRKFLQFDNFNSANSKAQSSCLNRFMVPIARQKEIYGLYLNYCKVVFRAIFCFLQAIVFPIDCYYQVLTYLMIPVNPCTQLGSYIQQNLCTYQWLISGFR